MTGTCSSYLHDSRDFDTYVNLICDSDLEHDSEVRVTQHGCEKEMDFCGMTYT